MAVVFKATIHTPSSTPMLNSSLSLCIAAKFSGSSDPDPHHTAGQPASPDSLLKFLRLLLVPIISS